ncbi:MAG TPA: dienelactone hydrolase family protein [Candidatus Hydrogenedentes bacterium]|nr:dienelactone hydrolase family protein [Candidatus Hydrogenedentota bacterium]
MVNLAKVGSLAQWRALRGEIEAAVLSLLGPLPKERVEIQTKTVDEMQFSGYVRRRVNYFVDEWERVSAWLFVPDRKDEMPGILCCHRAVTQGKDEPAGLEGDSAMFMAQRYAELGYVTIAPDCITAGDRISPGLAAYDTKAFYKDNPKASAMGRMLSDHLYALDVLCEVKRVDSARLGVIGHGLGAQNALFLAAFDERVQTCVASGGFTRFATDKDPGRWMREGGLVYFPQLREAIKSKKFPFDWEHILALCAPSPTLVVAAENDPEFGSPKSCEKAVELASNVYRLLGASEALELLVHDGIQPMPPEVYEAADDWFERWL